ncbi:MAG: nickel-dependent hydrogenase large subunit [Desulfovibrionaceae bacterium]
MGSCSAKETPGLYPVNKNNMVVVDPITRIEGHLRVETEVEGGMIKNAWSSSQLFRGLEIILKGRDPRDAQHFTQRACGVCTYVHALASTRAVEDAVGVRIPDNANIIRNLVMGAQYLHDHIVHFYALHALDWVDVVDGLSANPADAAKLANDISGGRRKATAEEFKAVQDKLKTFVASGQLGPFTNAYFLDGHPSYKLPHAANLMATADYLKALHLQVKAAQLMAIYGAKNPHTQFTVVGGVTCYEGLTPKVIAQYRELLAEVKTFVEDYYIPDLLAVASYYKDWAKIGGCTNFMSMGEFPETVDCSLSERYFPAGIIFNQDPSTIAEFDPKVITEAVGHSWYEAGQPLHPYQGVTAPKYTDLGDYDHYSWMKAPRYNGLAMETGPLAHCLVAYAKGHPEVTKYVKYVLEYLNADTSALFSTLGRTAGRGIECIVTANRIGSWIDQLEANLKKGDDKIYQDWKWKSGTYEGVGFVGAPRGGLSHWIVINKDKIENFQLVVPSTWNLGPRDDAGVPGPTEESLMNNTPIADPERPVEILRTVHSFDPCIACGVHVVDKRTGKKTYVKAL